jgi:multidrug efflux pump subunit AcrA (membrane-fusion protein)
MQKLYLFSSIILAVISSCKTGNRNEETSQSEGRVPVNVTSVSINTLEDAIELNATSVFLLKTYVKSNTNGYLQEVNIKPGDNVTKGEKIFVIRSKEAEYLDKTINKLDTSFRFTGLVNINSPGSGFVTQLSYRTGDYVQDGETLAAISDLYSLVFMLELPYELKPYLAANKSLILTLPDGQKLSGTLTTPMPAVDPVSQTQNYIIRISQGLSIPENLVAKVKFIRRIKNNAISLPKEAILTNEEQSEFWIMKMIDSITAIKVPVIKGIETSDRVEILSPLFNASDKILLSGNYGLPDTVKVAVENKEK